MDTAAAENLLNELETRYKKKIEDRKNSLENIKLKFHENSEAANSSLFGAYILNQRVLNETILNLKWCEWVRSIYYSKDFSFLDVDFD